MNRKHLPELVETLSDSPIQRFFIDLTSPESATLITPETVDSLRVQIHSELSAEGVNFETLASREMQQLLRERKLRDYATGKGAAIAAATPEGFINRFQEWAMSESSRLPKLVHGDESSRCRGLMQIMANTIAFAAGAVDSQTYLTDLKWRVGASYERPLKKKTEKASGDQKDSLRLQLGKVREAYSIPVPGKPGRKEYVGYSRVRPQSLNAFWVNMASSRPVL